MVSEKISKIGDLGCAITLPDEEVADATPLGGNDGPKEVTQ